MTAAQLVEQTSITQVLALLGGGEIRRGRMQAFYRKGADGWSVSIDAERGRWYDHRDNVGGGILDLIVHVRGGRRGEAARWLADMRGLTLDNAPLSAEDKWRYAQARERAPELSESAEMWWRARISELERLKGDALAYQDDVTLETVAREHYRLSK